MHVLVADGDPAIDETVGLVELLDELPERLARLVRRIEDPLSMRRKSSTARLSSRMSTSPTYFCR
jgi:hypothetical protein